MPFAYVDLDLMEENARIILKRSGNKKIRIASKSVRCTGILRHIFAMSDQFQGIMTFSAREACFLADEGFDDLLMGYPVFHEQDIRDICDRLNQGKTIVCMVDTPAQIHQLNTIGEACNTVLPVCLDADMSVSFPGLHFGVHRSSINEVDSAMRIYKLIEKAHFVRLDSLMGYEAQIAGVGDAVPGQAIKNALVKLLKRNAIKKVAKRRADIVRTIEAAGGKFRLVNGGGTGSLESTIQEPVVTEVTVGSGFYTSHLFDHYANFDHFPAAGYAIEVTRSPRLGILTCHGGGYTASGAAGKDKLPEPYLPKGAKLTPNEGAGEVQTPILYSGGEKIASGDPIFMRHAKAGELCERFTELYIIKNGKIVDTFPTYRGKGQCFL